MPIPFQPYHSVGTEYLVFWWLIGFFDGHILLMVEGVASSFGSSATSSLSSEYDGLETSSAVSDVVSIAGLGSEMVDSAIMVFSASSVCINGVSTTTALLR